jgi:hypothetical protein
MQSDYYAAHLLIAWNCDEQRRINEAVQFRSMRVDIQQIQTALMSA